MEKERIKEAIAKMEKGLNNPQIGEAQKDSLRKKIASLKGQIKEVEPKAKAEVKVIKKKIEKIDLEIAKSVEPKAKRKPARAKTTRAKSTEPKSSDNCTMTLAKEIRKEGETYTQALKRASSLMKEAKVKGLRASELAKKPKRTKKVITSTKRKKAAVTETPKRKKKVITSAKRKKAAMREVPDTTKRGLAADKKREALPVGKRTSAAGNTYYEYRRNRADRNAKRKFADGGEVDNYVVTNGEMFLSNRGGRFMLTDNVEMAYTYSKKEAEQQVKHAESLSKDNSKFKVESFRMYNKYAKGGGVDSEYSKMTEKEFLAKYFGANTFIGNPSEFFEIRKLSSSNDSKVEGFMEELKKEGFSIKKKSYSSFTSVMGVRKK
jgi:hypothetical protein